MDYISKFKVTEEMMVAFGELSGDYNPVHIDHNHATDKGFRGRVVYGGLIIAQISRMIGMEFPIDNMLWNGLKIDFIKPLMIGSNATIEATLTHRSEATSSVMIHFQIFSESITIAKGSIVASIL